MDKFYINAGARIKFYRRLFGYTRDEFAELAKISSKFLYEIENGKKGFSAATLARIAKVLNLKCEMLIGQFEIGEKDESLQQTDIFNLINKRTIEEMISFLNVLNDMKQE